MRSRAHTRVRSSDPTLHIALPFLGLMVMLSMFVAACSLNNAGGSSTATGPNGGGGTSTTGGQGNTFAKPPSIQLTPPVATSGNPDQPAMNGYPGIKPTLPGQVPAFSSDDMANFVLGRGFPNVGEHGKPKVAQQIFILNNEVEYLTGYTTGLPPTTQIGYVELQGGFDFPTPPNVPTITLPIAYMIFDASNGDIIGWGGLRQPSNPTVPPATPTPQPTATLQPTATPQPPTATPQPPTATPQQPTATPTPQKPPVLTVRPSKTTAFCSQGSYPDKISVDDTGTGVLNWSASAPSGITLTPSSGSLNPGGSQSVTISGIYSSSSSFVINVTSNGGAATVTVNCQVIG